jgi:hypothetical protein
MRAAKRLRRAQLQGEKFHDRICRRVSALLPCYQRSLLNQHPKEQEELVHRVLAWDSIATGHRSSS